jgi:hypothetical protein
MKRREFITLLGARGRAATKPVSDKLKTKV